LTSKHKKYKKPPKLPRKRLYAIIAASLVVVSILAVYSFGGQPSSGSSEPKAAIIDQLSSTEEFTNATFVNTATDILTAAGYQVTYYKGSDINVDFYQTLPTHGYRILIFRVHSALRLANSTTGVLTAPLDFFTSEGYSVETHVEMQELNQLDIVMYNQTSAIRYFGINPNFVFDGMEGNFQGATIILEGCNGLDGLGRSETMLQALVYRGAKAIIGWNASVSMDHADTATLDFLNQLLVDNQTVGEAINATANEIGPDLAYNNHLLYYPSRALGCGNNTVGDYKIQSVLNSTPTGAGYEGSLSLTDEGVLVVPLFLSANELHVFRKSRRKTSLISHNV
jgi:hypothetical protein